MAADHLKMCWTHCHLVELNLGAYKNTISNWRTKTLHQKLRAVRWGGFINSGCLFCLHISREFVHKPFLSGSLDRSRPLLSYLVDGCLWVCSLSNKIATQHRPCPTHPSKAVYQYSTLFCFIRDCQRKGLSIAKECSAFAHFIYKRYKLCCLF